MYCSNCGKSINENDKYCSNCGTKPKGVNNNSAFNAYPKEKSEFLEEYFLFRKFAAANLEKAKEQGVFKEVSKESLVLAMKNIYKDFNKYFEAVPNINEYYFCEATKYSIEKYIDAEMDYSTPGIRGIGRASTFIPRFGGFYSKYLKNLSDDELNIIKNTIFKIIKLGYETAVAMEVVLELEPIKLKNFDILPFFNKWILKIYTVDFVNDSRFGSFIGQSAWESIIYFCFKIADTTEFPNKFLALKNATNSKLSFIINKYVEAGFLLRYLETPA